MEITVKGIKKYFAGRCVIPDLSMTVQDHSLTVILGPSGCGKTTLLRMIAGLERPDSGEILFDGVPVFSLEKRIFVPPEKRGLGFVFQDLALWPHMTVWDNICFGLRQRGRKADIPGRVPDIIRAVRLEGLERRYPGELSGGQQQRAALARALACTSSCILLDEPLSALDAVLRETMRRELRRLSEQFRVTFVLVTHDQAEAMCLADRIAVLSEGKLEQYGTPEDIYQKPESLFTASFIGHSNWLGQGRMFRPEAIHIEKEREDDISFQTEVTGVRYMGGYFEADLKYGQESWMMRSLKRAVKGQTVRVYVSPEDIVNMTGGRGI